MPCDVHETRSESAWEHCPQNLHESLCRVSCAPNVVVLDNSHLEGTV
jgi:hypothetical protein